jgi:hypothetical protein
MFNDEELEEIRSVIYFSICEGYNSEEINSNLKNVISKLDFPKEDLEEMENISGKKIL